MQCSPLRSGHDTKHPLLLICLDPALTVSLEQHLLVQFLFKLKALKMEVCVDSVQSAINAAAGGATRLELCSALSEGGLTPTPGLLKVLKYFSLKHSINMINCLFVLLIKGLLLKLPSGSKNGSKIPVYCMLRIRGGNNFIFSSDEIEAMKTDALLLRAVGRPDGFVFGALTKQGFIDVEACKLILQVTIPLPVTFHRAIDACNEPLNAIAIIADLGFTRILTSGQKSTAVDGIPLIKKMVERAGESVSVMVASGVRKENVAYILEQTGATEYHGSAKASAELTDNLGVPKMGSKDAHAMADKEEVSETVKAAQTVLLLRK